MGNFKWTDKEVQFLIEAVAAGKRPEDLLSSLGRTKNGILLKAKELGLVFALQNDVNRGFRVEKPASVSRPIEQLIAEQSENYRAKQSRAETKRAGIEVTLDHAGPFAIVLFGDPHVDDDGTDLEYLAYCMDFVRSTPHTYALNIGDLSNNWIGRLARLYAHQHTTDDEGIKLVEWLIEAIPWLAVILGNHDKWGPVAEMACRKAGVLSVSHGARFNVRCGDKTLKIDARHDHPGRSQYNAAFAQGKQQYRGSDCHVIAGGHIHTGAYLLVKNGVSGRVGHCIRLGAFKRYDEYADSHGFSDDSIGPACMVVVDPSQSEDSPSFCSVFWNLEHGAKFLEAIS